MIVQKALYELDGHLMLRSYIAGHAFGTADVAIWSSIRCNRMATSVIKSRSNAMRWYNYIEWSQPWLLDIVAELNAHSKQASINTDTGSANYDIGAFKTKTPMVTRFPPEPSGYMHIGHAKASLLNDYFAHQSPGGTLICRFDDTNPTNESLEFQDAILSDLKSIGIYPNRVTYSSVYFQQMHDLAIKMIEDGNAFADDSELGKGGEDRKKRLPSRRRDMSIEETLARFADMTTGSDKGRCWCIRARIAYDSPNGTLRDPVIYRCNLTPHHRTGTTWKVYPTYDFCAPILDSIEGVTLALRTNEYRDRNAQYEWIQDVLGLRKVKIWDFSRLNFNYAVLSKRKLTKIVNEGKVWGWDDPRMPTVRGILRRGLTAPALREFIIKQGPSQNILNLEWGALWALNKKYIDPVSPRHTAIVQNNAVRCKIIGADLGKDGFKSVDKPKHAKNSDLGSKKVIYSESILIEQSDAQSVHQGEKITLMNWGNAVVDTIFRNGKAENIKEMVIKLCLDDTDFKGTKKITWLADANLVNVDLLTFDHLVTKKKLQKEDVLENFVNPNTLSKEEAFADCNVRELPEGAIVQFERKGYFKLDSIDHGGEKRMFFFDVPSGRA